MPFCPNCGVAEQATALNPLPLVGTGAAAAPGGIGRWRPISATATSSP